MITEWFRKRQQRLLKEEQAESKARALLLQRECVCGHPLFKHHDPSTSYSFASYTDTAYCNVKGCECESACVKEAA